MKIYLATANQHKIAEFTQIAEQRGLGITFHSALPYIGSDRWQETGTTFEENALIKANFFAQRLPNKAIVADDSGLEVFALGGAPGVYSSSYAGIEGDSAANNRKLTSEMQGKSDRNARFVCVICLRLPNEQPVFFRGECKGYICDTDRGQQGFGYDPLFIPTGYNQTFSELGEDIKNRISHRGQATDALFAKLAGLRFF